jgi:hypothetical protein
VWELLLGANEERNLCPHLLMVCSGRLQELAWCYNGGPAVCWTSMLFNESARGIDKTFGAVMSEVRPEECAVRIHVRQTSEWVGSGMRWRGVQRTRVTEPHCVQVHQVWTVENCWGSFWTWRQIGERTRSWMTMKGTCTVSSWAGGVAHVLKNLPSNCEPWVQSVHCQKTVYYSGSRKS